MVQGFDPAAATQAYLAILTPAQHAKATAYTHGSEWLLLVERGGRHRGRLDRHQERPAGAGPRWGAEGEAASPWRAILAIIAVDTVAEKS